MIPFKTFTVHTFKFPYFPLAKKRQTFQILSAKISTGLFIQQTQMKAHNVRGTGVSKSRQFCPCLKDISVFSKQEAYISLTTI